MTPSINRFVTRLGKMVPSHILVLLALMLGCSTTKDIRFVMPPGFRGVIEISANEKGVELTGSSMTLFVPGDGKMQVKNLSYFDGWKNYEVIYSSGQKLSVHALSERTVQGTQFWPLGWSKGTGGSYSRFFVGDRAELEAYLRAKRDGEATK